MTLFDFSSQAGKVRVNPGAWALWAHSKLRGGTAPFTLLADGVPVQTGLRQRETVLPMAGLGFVTLSVVDAEGRSNRVRFWLR